MTKTILLTAAALLALPLAACENEPIVQGAEDPLKEAAAKAPKVELPPAIKATVTLRCKDNSLIYVEFFAGDKLANLRTEKDGAPIRLTAEKAGDPLIADGYSMKGTPKLVTLTQPGKPAQSCKA
ncbi:MAG: hypothetical protein C0500_05915 [Sphingobium sp.]|nr:hypothetical protein [Sphingobium sp.]